MSRIQVLDRAAAVMQILAASDEPTRLQTIADQAGLVPSTTRRILLSLCDLGFCEQPSPGSYRLGLGLFELGKRVEAGFDIRRVSRGPLQQLSALTEVTSFLCVRQEDRAVAIDRIEGKYAASLALTVGGSLPLHVGAAPRAILAAESEETIRAYLARATPIEKRTQKTVTDPAAILAQLLEAKERGWVISDEDVTPGIAALGVPVYGHSGDSPVASISLSGLVPHVLGAQQDRFVRLLRETADTISRSIGRGPVGATRSEKDA